MQGGHLHTLWAFQHVLIKLTTESIFSPALKLCPCFSKALQSVGGTGMEQSMSFPHLADPCTPTQERRSLQWLCSGEGSCP